MNYDITVPFSTGEYDKILAPMDSPQMSVKNNLDRINAKAVRIYLEIKR
jgi:hypothetical protein